MKKLCLSLVALVALTGNVYACPTCTPMPMTLSDDIDTSASVVIAEQVEGQTTRYRVIETLKGLIKPGQLITAASSKAKTILLTTAAPPGTPFWTGRPVAADPGVLDFARKALQLPHRFGANSEAKRLRFFARYLGNRERIIADAAYGELSLASYKSVARLAPEAGAAKLRSWLADPATPRSYRSLYYVMLGSLADRADLKMVEPGLERAAHGKGQTDLGAMLVCYLCLEGSHGVARVDRDFVHSDRARRSSAIQALRMMANENDRLPRQSVFPIFRRELSDPNECGPILQDLAVWQDWDSLPDVVRLAQTSKDRWVRVSAARYLRTCPLPAASRALARMSATDPQSVRDGQEPFRIPVSGS